MILLEGTISTLRVNLSFGAKVPQSLRERRERRELGRYDTERPEELLIQIVPILWSIKLSFSLDYGLLYSLHCVDLSLHSVLNV